MNFSVIVDFIRQFISFLLGQLQKYIICILEPELSQMLIKPRIIATLFLLGIMVSSCSLTKRRYMPGYYWDKKQEVVAQKGSQDKRVIVKNNPPIPVIMAKLSAATNKNTLERLIIKNVLAAKKNIVSKINLGTAAFQFNLVKSNSSNKNVANIKDAGGNPAHGWVIAAALCIIVGAGLVLIGPELGGPNPAVLLFCIFFGSILLIIGLVFVIVALLVSVNYNYLHDEEHSKKQN